MGSAHVGRGTCHGYVPRSSTSHGTDLPILPNATNDCLYPLAYGRTTDRRVFVPTSKDKGRHPWHKHSYCILHMSLGIPRVASASLH